MTVTPFSHPRYADNEEHCTVDETPCVVCGKPIKNEEKAKWIRVVDGGARFAGPDETIEDEAADMGCFPIGPGCLRKHRKELGPLIDK